MEGLGLIKHHVRVDVGSGYRVDVACARPVSADQNFHARRANTDTRTCILEEMSESSLPLEQLSSSLGEKLQICGQQKRGARRQRLPGTSLVPRPSRAPARKRVWNLSQDFLALLNQHDDVYYVIQNDCHVLWAYGPIPRRA